MQGREKRWTILPKPDGRALADLFNSAAVAASECGAAIARGGARLRGSARPPTSQPLPGLALPCPSSAFGSNNGSSNSQVFVLEFSLLLLSFAS